jgi:K+/H+ antiporter YhaU regulatory subunit KhtT
MIREDGYRALRQKRPTDRKPIFDKSAIYPNIKVEILTVGGESPVSGRSIADLMFRKKTGATIVAVERDNETITSPDPDFTLMAGDIVFITGKKENINKAIVYLTEGDV